ncbi:hypothetical protein FOFC_09249 [Fusarium oxysporum]|nr:hypothetical protein FOFC_09249 [Fusarium oxysporum]
MGAHELQGYSATPPRQTWVNSECSPQMIIDKTVRISDRQTAATTPTAHLTAATLLV